MEFSYCITESDFWGFATEWYHFVAGLIWKDGLLLRLPVKIRVVRESWKDRDDFVGGRFEALKYREKAFGLNKI